MKDTKDNKSNLAELLLDSSLILATSSNKELYNFKVIDCNDYIQIYKFKDKQVKINKNLENNNIEKIDTDYLYKSDKEKKKNEIELKNIIRSKLECQRLAKCNSKEWKTFITLTFEKNIIDINSANISFKCFIYKVKRIFKEFKYICIPEFQKRGAVHYHLLTNIDINNTKLIYCQEDNNYFKHIKYWNEGFNKVDILNNDIKKIIGYISKYMTKDIDNRLFNHHRYFYSRNLIKPKINYINLDDSKHLDYLNNLLKNKKIVYKNNYLNKYNDDLITFEEYM